MSCRSRFAWSPPARQASRRQTVDQPALFVRENPLGYERAIVEKRQVPRIKTGGSANGRKLDAKLHVAAGHLPSAPQCTPPTRRLQPTTHSADSACHIIVVRLNILSTNVRTKDLISVRVSFENQAGFSGLRNAAKPLRAEEYSQFQGHVEARKPIVSVQGHSRKIMYTIAALADDLVELLKTNFTPVVLLARAARAKATVVDCENQRVKELLVPAVEGDIDEHTFALRWHRAGLGSFAAGLVRGCLLRASLRTAHALHRRTG